MKLFQWQQRIIDREKTFTLKQLLDEVIEQATGDDHDGCFTKEGSWEFEYLKKRLYQRMNILLDDD